MLDWIGSNIRSVIAVILLAAVIFLIIRSMIKDLKAGKTLCSGSCQGCALKGQCHKNE